MLEAELFAFLEKTADAAFAVTREGQICSWNQAAERLFGYSSLFRVVKCGIAAATIELR